MTGPILVVGGGGRLGQMLQRLGGSEVIGLDRQALDIANANAIEAVLRAVQPRLIINAAAMSDVNGCERDSAAAFRANRDGPATLCAGAAWLEVPLLHVSTDYVFGADGLDRPRTEADPPAPINVYGQSKLAGEQAVLQSEARSCVVRVAWLFGYRGDFIDRMLSKARSEPVIRVTDQTGTPTPLVPLAKALLDLGKRMVAKTPTPPLLHIAGAPATTRADWVGEALESVHSRAPMAKLERVSVDQFQDQAARPKGTPLDTSLYASMIGHPMDWRAEVRAWALECMQ